MAARLDLIAHGASRATRAARFPDDDGLEAAAVAALHQFAGRLRPYRRVLTAPARAARETAAALGCEAEVDAGLRDWDYGLWRGLALVDVAKREPDAFAAWLIDPAAAPHGGEPLIALIERAGAFLAQSMARDGATLAITHAAVVRAAIVSALGAGAAAFWRIDVAPLFLAKLTGRDGRWNLTALGPLSARAVGRSR